MGKFDILTKMAIIRCNEYVMNSIWNEGLTCAVYE